MRTTGGVCAPRIAGGGALAALWQFSAVPDTRGTPRRLPRGNDSAAAGSAPGPPAQRAARQRRAQTHGGGPRAHLLLSLPSPVPARSVLGAASKRKAPVRCTHHSRVPWGSCGTRFNRIFGISFLSSQHIHFLTPLPTLQIP
jgi:hypothetical protein